MNPNGVRKIFHSIKFHPSTINFIQTEISIFFINSFTPKWKKKEEKNGRFIFKQRSLRQFIDSVERKLFIIKTRTNIFAHINFAKQKHNINCPTWCLGSGNNLSLTWRTKFCKRKFFFTQLFFFGKNKGGFWMLYFIHVVYDVATLLYTIHSIYSTHNVENDRKSAVIFEIKGFYSIYHTTIQYSIHITDLLYNPNRCFM